MSDAWCSCKPCSSSDPTQDTVKIDPTALRFDPVFDPPFTGKENLQPHPNLETAEMESKREAEKLRLEQEERLRAEEADERRQKQAEEDAKLEAEAVRAAETERLQREEAEEKARREVEAAISTMPREAEEGPRKEPTGEMEEKRQATIKVSEWCRNNGFTDMNSPKKTFKGNTKYPLHTAVKYWSVDMVELMVKLGVNKNVKDSKGRTPVELVEAKTSCQARQQMLRALR